MKKKNRPDVPVGACLTLVYSYNHADTFKQWGPDEWYAAERPQPLAPPFTTEELWGVRPILGWVVVDTDGTVTIGPQ